MDIRQLRYFIAIAEEGNITAAARRLHMAQPPLSQQLKLMEAELGVILLERNGKKSEITDAGFSLYKHALRVTSLLYEGIKEIKEIGQGIQGQLNIGINTLSSYPLAQYLLKFKEKFPHVTYKIIQEDSPHLSASIEERSLDLAIVRLPIEEEKFESVKLEKESFVAVFPNSMNIDKKSMDIGDITSYPLILPSVEGLGIHSMIMSEFNRLELQPNIIGECSDIALLLQLVASGFGVSIVPRTVLNVHPGICINHIPITDTLLQSEAAIIWLKNRYISRAAEQFITLLREARSMP